MPGTASIVVGVHQLHPLQSSQHELPPALTMPEWQWAAYCAAVRRGRVCYPLICCDRGPRMLIAMWQDEPEEFVPFMSWLCPAEEKLIAELRRWQDYQGAQDYFSIVRFSIAGELALIARVTVVTVFLPWTRGEAP